MHYAETKTQELEIEVQRLPQISSALLELWQLHDAHHFQWMWLYQCTIMVSSATKPQDGQASKPHPCTQMGFTTYPYPYC